MFDKNYTVILGMVTMCELPTCQSHLVYPELSRKLHFHLRAKVKNRNKF